MVAGTGSEQRAHRDIIKDSQPRKWPRDLKRASESQSGATISRQMPEVVSFERQIAQAGSQRSTDQAHQRGFAGAVWADETQNLATLNVQAQARQCDQALETLCEAANSKEGRRHGFTGDARGRSRRS